MQFHMKIAQRNKNRLFRKFFSFEKCVPHNYSEKPATYILISFLTHEKSDNCCSEGLIS